MASRGALVVRFVGDTRDLEKSTKTAQSRLKKMSAASSVALAAIGVAAVKFGTDSVKAYAEAESSQNRLTDAYTKFPKMANVSLGSLQKLNTTLAQKTKFDDDATASGQAVLAQFGLTGKQVKKLTPLLQDYAAKTGKDLPTAAKDLGKSVMGQGRALKNIGLNFEDTGSKAGNLGQLMGGLRQKVGGFAEKEGKTAAGRAEILKNQFGELQEKVGGGLMPILQKLVGVLTSAATWVTNNTGAALAMVGVLTTVAVALKVAATWTTIVSTAQRVAAAGQWLLNAAMSANPIALVVIAIAALVAGLVWFFTKTKVGKKIWASFTKFLVVAWDGVKRGLSAAWKWIQEKVFKPIGIGIKLVGLGFKVYGAVIRVVFNKVRDALGTAWKWIQNKVFAPVKNGIRLVGVGFKIYGAIIRAAFGRVKDSLGAAWGWIKKRVFSPITNFITQTIPNAFRTGVSKVKDFWNGLKKAARVPVKFLVNTVWNNGLRTMLNAIPGVDIKPIKLGFAKGGSVNGPGTGTSDSVPARLSKGEHVWTAREVAAVGGQKTMYGMRKAALAGHLEFAKGGALDAGAIARAQTFAKQQAGKPYVWGSAGPGGYDCSGFMSAITNVLQNQAPYRRRGATADFPWAGFQKGPGQFTIGSTKNYGGSGIGHMAGNLAGLGVESRGGTGVILGSGAMPPSGFPGVYHLGQGGKGGAGGGFVSIIADAIDKLKKLPGQIKEMLTGDTWIGSFLKKLAAGLWKNIAGMINKAIPDVGPIKTNPIPSRIPTFDHGGTLSPGYNTVYNGLGRPESLRRTDEPAVGQQQVVHVSLDGAMGKEVLRLIRREVKTGGNNPMIVLRG